MRTRGLMLSLLILLLTASVAVAAARLPERQAGPFAHVGTARLTGDMAQLNAALSEPAAVRYRFILVEETGGEDREAYLDRVLAAQGWPEPDQLLLVIFTKANHDVRFAMGADFTAAGVTVSELVGLLRSEFFANVEAAGPAGALARFVRAVNRRLPAGGALSPQQVVSRFYDWHLGYFSRGGGYMSGNALGDRAYRTSPYLAPAYVGTVDKDLDRMAAAGGGADPFLCAQNLPLALRVGVPAQSSAEQSQVPVRLEWGGGRETVLTAHLGLRDGRWEINRIACPGR